MTRSDASLFSSIEVRSGSSQLDSMGRVSCLYVWRCLYG